MSDNQELPLQPVPTMTNDKDENINIDLDNEPKYSGDEQEPKLATVKMLLESIGQTVTVAFPLRSPISELITHFAKELRMPEKILQVTFKEKVLDNQLSLSQIEVEPNTTVSMELHSKDPINEPLRPYKLRQDISMPDVITVRIDEGQSMSRDVVVEIERNNFRKPYLGGVRHRMNGKEFHHASAQTLPPQRPDKGVIRYCRDTQTIQARHRVIQTTNEQSTQMSKPGYFVTTDNDRFLTPHRYQTAEEKFDILNKKAIIIQKYFRRWLAKRDVNILREAFQARLQYEFEEKQRKIQERQNRYQHDLDRRLNPRTKDDFDVLYAALEKWREEEIAKINATKQGASRKAALALLVDEETELLATIDRYKTEAQKYNKEVNIQRFIERVAQPKRWKYKDGTTTEMDTPYSIRARELMQIYNTITMKFLTLDERLDILLTLKHTVKEHECRLTQEVIQLIDREADLLMRGTKEENLSGLRQRIATLFLQYIKTPTFNPGVVRHLKVPQDPVIAQEQKTLYCRSCQKYYPSTEFSVSSTNANIGKCRQCFRLENIANKRTDQTKFKFLLKKIEKEECAYSDGARCIFFLTTNDMEYMFKNIWDSHSVLSEESDIYTLTFVRWNRREEFSPWNCILLTLQEASAHLKMEDVEANYSEPFRKKIRYKHAVSRSHFLKLVEHVSHYHEQLQQANASKDMTITALKIGRQRGTPTAMANTSA
ncbi:unnamed protein product [Rotaria magnacalcarata]|uniref:Ubiquitin-like domain-containing protein n=1 Tax=Rotaria magnacalcarata TaxID=392030 RepID=A0A815TM68_9BILA|nr:unnamed protein product [Rotaria magnacalcarata]CAF1641367.1 unnamed protein product [Rotaria magnacalcarata]CAF2206020.1 unnamed protein product [Rotaria magnacalcarata]CAF3793431.1 unnamed protein product [Rotaria magnacalcarata]CAF3843916.1 unnamed protein product [Rotaria magnacalcarata]